jgi:hypothetical protein
MMKMNWTNSMKALTRGAVTVAVAMVLGGCGSNNTSCPAGTVPMTDEIGTRCAAPMTSTQTGSETDTKTTTTTTTTTAVSTFNPPAHACDEHVSISEFGSATAQVGLWTVSKVGSSETWSVCITNAYSDNLDLNDIRVYGYGVKTEEFKQANQPSLVRYEGVMGHRCILVHPTSVNSNGYEIIGNAMAVSGNGSVVTVTDTVYNATWAPLTGSGCKVESVPPA